MKKIFPILNVLCLSIALASAPLQAQKEDNQINLQSQKITDEDYYITHLGTGFLASIASRILLATGFLVSGLTIDPLSRKLNFDRLVKQQKDYLIIPAIASWIGAIYILYKMPQWTDDYLDLEVKRSGKDNVKTLLWRCLPYPLGVLVGEYSQRLRNEKRLKKTLTRKITLPANE